MLEATKLAGLFRAVRALVPADLEKKKGSRHKKHGHNQIEQAA